MINYPIHIISNNLRNMYYIFIYLLYLPFTNTTMDNNILDQNTTTMDNNILDQKFNDYLVDSDSDFDSDFDYLDEVFIY